MSRFLHDSTKKQNIAPTQPVTEPYTPTCTVRYPLYSHRTIKYCVIAYYRNTSSTMETLKVWEEMQWRKENNRVYSNTAGQIRE